MAKRRRTITLELKAELDDEQYAAIKLAAQTVASMFLTQATLLADKRPQIFLHGEDFAHTETIPVIMED